MTRLLDCRLSSALASHETLVRAAHRQLQRETRFALRLELGRLLAELDIADEDVAARAVARWNRAPLEELFRAVDYLRRTAAEIGQEAA